jgi:hypothetical protein
MLFRFHSGGPEGRGVSPAAHLRGDKGALAAEATGLQGLEACSALCPDGAGLKTLCENLKL